MEKSGNPGPLVAMLVLGIFLGVLGAPLVWSSDPLPPPATPGPEESVPPDPTELTAGDKAGRSGSADTEAAEATTTRQPIPGKPVGADESLGVIVFGTVQSADGKSIDGAQISFESPVAGAKHFYTMSKNGGYTLHGLKPGKWETLIRRHGFKQTKTEVTIEDVPMQRIDLSAEPSYLVTIRVKSPKGNPFREARTAAKIPGMFLLEPNAVATLAVPDRLPMTDLRYHSRLGIGSWTSALSSPGQDMPAGADVLGVLELSQRPPAYVSLVLRHHILATKRLEPGTEELTFTLSIEDFLAHTANVRVRVLDARTGQGIAKARVSISDRQSGGGGQPTGEDGTVVLKHQATGLMEMYIRAKEYESYHVKLRLAAGEVDLGTVELGPPAKTRVLVVDASGAPQKASLSWTNLDRRSFPQPLIRSRSADTDSSGLGELWGIGRGRYLVQARIRGEALATEVIDTGNPGEQPVRLVLAPTWPVVLDNTGMSKRRALTALIRDAQRRIVYGNYLRIPYRFDTRLPAGRYTFHVFDGLKETQTGAFTVTEGGSATVKVTG